MSLWRRRSSRILHEGAEIVLLIGSRKVPDAARAIIFPLWKKMVEPSAPLLTGGLTGG
jgi:hypothetical protein